jgi:hypothetical protein
MRLRFLGSAIVVLLTAASAAAQAPSEVTAVAYRELPAGLAVQVQLLDDSDLNLQVRDMIVEQLTAQGYTVSDTAPFLLQVETQTAAESDQGPSLGSFEATDEEAEIRMNLWSNSQDSLLNPQEEDGATGSRYRISLGLYDGRDGRYYWRGAVSSALEDGDPASASRDMVSALLAHFGDTARGGDTAPAQ